MSWVIAGSILGWIGAAAAFGLFDGGGGDESDDDAAPDPDIPDPDEVDDDIVPDSGDPDNEPTPDPVVIDEVLTGRGDDTLFGAEGDDTLTGASGGANDLLYGGDGEDDLRLGREVYGGAGDDTLSASGKAYGDAGNDALSGSELYGGAGNDLVEVTGQGGETIRPGSGEGGTGDDTISGYDTGGSGAGATLSGGAGSDLILSDANSRVFAGAGNDTVIIFGAFENDAASGGQITLGDGADLLALAPAGDPDPVDGSPDTYVPDDVTDFDTRTDQLAIIIPPGDVDNLSVTITVNAGEGHTDVELQLPTPPEVPGDPAGTSLQSVRLEGVTELDPADILLFTDVEAVQAGTSYGTLASA